MRLFLGIRFNEQMNKALMGTLHDLKVHGVKGNYVPAQNLHITIAFIGETEKTREIEDTIGSVQIPAMRISLDKLSMYGNILVAEVKNNQKLKEYAADVRSALDFAGIDYDHKKFVPHITLVRKANGGYKDVTLPQKLMAVERVSLMKSVRVDGKMIYSEIAGWDK